MSAEGRNPNFAKELLTTTKRAAIGGFPAGFAGVLIIIARNHKELAHRNIKLSPRVQRVLDLEQRMGGVGEPEVWAAVHREPHHQFADTNLHPFYEISRAARWVEENPTADAAQDIVIPDYFTKLDPGVLRFTREDVLKIGSIAENILREKLGNEYRELEGYTRQELERILDPNPEKPKFWYPPYKKHSGKWTQDEIAQILLRDPHSPPLMPPRKHRTNGVRGVKRSNLFLYRTAANLFRAGERHDLKPIDLQTGKEDQYKKPWKEVTAGFVVPASAIFAARALRGKHSWKNAAIAAVAGSAFNGVRYAVKIAGGNEVNSIGHPGEIKGSIKLLEAELASEFYILPNEEGKYSGNTSDQGALGKLIKFLAGDEPDQGSHHSRPDEIRHPSNRDLEGLAAFADTPTGSLIELGALSKKVPGIEVGEGFDVPFDERPDMPNEAVLLVEKRRREQRVELLEIVKNRTRRPSRRERYKIKARDIFIKSVKKAA